MSKRKRRITRVLLITIAVAVVIRIVTALFMGNTVQPAPGIHDQVSYDRLAQRVVEGHGFSFDVAWWPATQAGKPTAHWSYLYTLYLAGIYAILGHNPLVARLFQALMAGVLHPWLSWRIGRRLFGESAGLAAAGISAVYVYFIYYAGALMTECFHTLGVLWFMDLGTWIIGTQCGRQDFRGAKGDKTKKGMVVNAAEKQATGDVLREKLNWVLLGVAIGIAALLRQVVLLFVPFLLVWLIWIYKSKRRAIAGSLATLLVIGMTVAPWTIRNYRVFGQFVLLNTNAGFAFFWGNHPIHETDFIPILPREGPSYQELIPEELRGLEEAALDRALLAYGLGFVTSDPKRYFALSLSRAKEYFKFWPTSDSSLASNLGRTISFGLLLPLALIGLAYSIALGHRHRNDDQPSYSFKTMMPLYLFIIVYSGIHLLSWSLIRYRLPVDSILVLFAGAGGINLLNMLRPKHRPSRSLGRTSTESQRKA